MSNQSQNYIEHSGIVSEITSSKINVEIEQSSACASCQVKGFCTSLDSRKKIIEVECKEPLNLKIGDRVIVEIKESLGLYATFLAYFLPIIVLIICLSILLSIGISEGLSAIFSILVVALYFFILHLFNDKLKKQFQFKIRKIN